MLAIDESEFLQILDACKPIGLESLKVVLEVERFENLLVASNCGCVFLFEIQQNIAHTNTHAANLIGVGRTDALACCSHFVLTLGRLVCGVEQTVGRQNQVRLLRYVKAFGKVVSRLRKCLGFSLEQRRVEHYSVAYDVHLVALENSRRNRAQNIFFTIEFERVPCIGSALETSYHIVFGGEHVNNFTFSLVAPLKS